MSVSHPASDDLSLPESLASVSLSCASRSVKAESGEQSRRESDDSECDAPQAESLTPTTSTSISTDASSPTSSLLSHSRDLSFEEKEAPNSNASTPTNGPMAHTSGDSASPFSGERGVNEKRPSQYDNRRNLHVDNLPPMTEVEFRNLFLRYGAIARSRIVTDAITGLHAGYGFVMFEHEEDALLAMHSLHNTNLPNSSKPLRVTVKKPKTAKAWEREREKELEKQKLLAHGAVNIQSIFVNTNLYVAGLPSNWTKREMDEIFSQFGMILESRILLEKHSHVSKGVGFVRFQQLECCHQAIQALNGKPAPVPLSLEATGKGNASAANPNVNREDCKQNLTVRFAVDKTAQALAVAQQTVMGTLNQQRSSNVQHNTQQHHSHSHSEANAAGSNQNYLAVLNSANQQSPQRSNSPRMHTLLNTAPFGGAVNGLTPQQIQSLLAMQQQQFARVAALATVNGTNRASFSAATAAPNVTATTFAFAAPSASSASSFASASPDYSAYSLESALLLSQLNSPLTSSALSFNSMAAAVLNPMNALPSLALAPPANNTAALNQFYAASSLPTLANQVFV